MIKVNLNVMKNKSMKQIQDGCSSTCFCVFWCRQPSLLQLLPDLEFVSVFFDLCLLPSHIVPVRPESCASSCLFISLSWPLSSSSPPLPSPRMSVRGRSAWPWQVAFLVALVMLWADPASAGNRNHRGPTGNNQVSLWISPPPRPSTATRG